MRGSEMGWLGILAAALLGVLTQEAKAERSLSRKEIEKELRHLRDSLHEAHLELANKADRIAELEAQIKADGEMSSVPEGNSSGKPSRPALIAKAVKPAPDPVVMAAPDDSASCQKDECSKPVPASGAGGTDEKLALEILYDINSAVSYEGREEVLQFVRKTLKEHPVTLFSVTGYANDSSFRTKDLDIAHNRARFLVDYLTIRGVSEDVFTEVSGVISSNEGSGGRVVIIKGVRGD